METRLIHKDNQQQAITSSLNQDENYFYKLQRDKVYTIKEYADLKVKDANSEYVGEELARYHIGNALERMYELIGIPKKDYPSTDLAKRIARFIQKTFPYIAPVEIVDAVEFALQEKFSIKRKDGSTLLDHYRNVDLKLISEFLHVYVKWRYDKKIKLLEKIEKNNPVPYHIMMENFIRDDNVVKTEILNAFNLYISNPEDEKLYQALMGFRHTWFDFMVQCGLVKYNADELNAKYREMIKNPLILPSEAKHKLRVEAILKSFEKWDETTLDIFNSVSYLSSKTY